MIDDLSALERDALAELVNIAVNGAALRLRAMVGSPVALTVPVVEILSDEEAAKALAGLGLEALVAVRQTFAGRVSGQTMLVFTDRDSRQLSRAVLGEGYSDDEFLDLHDDTLGEVGNILLLGFLATIGSMLKLTFDVSVPTVEAAGVDHVFGRGGSRAILLIHVDFHVRQLETRGYFLLVLGLGTLVALRQVLDVFLDSLNADAG